MFFHGYVLLIYPFRVAFIRETAEPGVYSKKNFTA
ncbi:hypothetical protein AU15_05200 [Marinobacter salarius]|uniref:Uncharacterized protein n=1 Tax=Marinobacter salarius TaxID=1420917 RepID=W5YV86_9GAMM|nr:hypothetical protein AU15_05200 [Marinobacter salarius]